MPIEQLVRFYEALERYDKVVEWCKKIEEDGRVTISLGVTEIRLAESIKKNYHRACQACYIVKEMGGNGVKRN